jgi:PAS domain S-box-containing protein
MINPEQNEFLNRAFANLVEESVDFIAVTDQDGRIRYLNPAACNAVGLGSRDNLSERRIQEFFPEWPAESFIRDGRLIDPSNISHTCETVLNTLHANRAPVLLSITANLTAGRHVDHLAVSARDLSEQRQLEANLDTLESRLVDLCRTHTVGAIAVGLAHNLNDSLVRIGRNVGVAIEATDDLSNAHNCLNRAFESINSARRAVQRMVAACSTESDYPHEASIQPVIKEAISLARASLPHNIIVRQKLEDQPIKVPIDPIQVHQIVMNLVINAKDAMARTGGVIEVALESIDFGEPVLKKDAPTGERRWARIRISDSGPGLDKDRIDPPLSVNSANDTTLDDASVNLIIVTKLVERNRGALTIHTRRGWGTTYYVFLPQSAPLAADVNEA